MKQDPIGSIESHVRRSLRWAGCLPSRFPLLLVLVLIIGGTPSGGQALPPTKPSSEYIWEYWSHEELKELDPWGDSDSDETDLIALYEKENIDTITFRLDIMDFQAATISPTYFAVDYKAGGNTRIDPANNSILFDIEWDLMIAITETGFTLFDASFVELPSQLPDTQMDSHLDLVAFSVSKTAFAGWDGTPFLMQALVTDLEGATELDRTAPVFTDETTGRAKLVLPMQACTGWDGPSSVSWYDGYALQPDKHPGVRRGFRYLLDAVETYGLPLTVHDLTIDNGASNEYLRINERFRYLASTALLDPLSTAGHGHFMAWQPDDVDAKAIEIASEIRQDLDLPTSMVYYPYEAMITAGDIEVIQEAGFEATYGIDQYRYWLGWIEDWSNPEVVQADIESLRKIHLINGMPFVFHTAAGNYQGFFADERWGEIDWDEFSEYEQYEGTDQGLDLWWRRILHDMAIDPDQEQFFTIGTDYTLTAWMFPDIVDWNFKWLASHPWIEVTTFSDILGRNWQVVDHGDLGLGPEELLIQYQPDGDMHYNAYFPQFYYGGISDGHSPLIPEGEEIEAYYDYVPYLRGGQPIPSGRIMGDDDTLGSIVFETLDSLRAAPDNALTRLAWQAYFVSICEQTFHAQTDYAGGEPAGNDWGGQYLHPDAKASANKMRQVNKIVSAARWAADVAGGSVNPTTQVFTQDLDLDGEDEYVLRNNQVYAIFENDGARLEYAFAVSPQHGPLQLVAPLYQSLCSRIRGGWNFEEGEIGEIAVMEEEAAFADIINTSVRGDQEYSASIENDTLIFSHPSFGLTKTFTLIGDTIYAQYDLNNVESVEPGFGLVVNLMNMYSLDWSDNVERIQVGQKRGWQANSGGKALVSMDDLWLEGDVSFNDSPARDEQQERSDPTTYPSGHWLAYPQNCLLTHGYDVDDDIHVSLTLSADPLRRVFLPVIVRGD